MPQAALVNDDDHASELMRQTGQKFHRAQGNKHGPTGQLSNFSI
jgi:hypothetical protein